MQLLQTRPTHQATIADIDEPSKIWPLEDLAFAGRAALYLDKKGLNHRAVVQCLIDELELDRETAEAVAALAA